MNHDIGVVWHRLLRRLVASLLSLGLIHLHIIISPFFTFGLFLIFFAFCLKINFLTASFRSSIIFSSRASSLLTARHVSILTLRDYTFSFNLILFLFLVSAVLVAVCDAQVGLGLVGGELWWGRFLRIPYPVSSCLKRIPLRHTI